MVSVHVLVCDAKTMNQKVDGTVLAPLCSLHVLSKRNEHRKNRNEQTNE